MFFSKKIDMFFYERKFGIFFFKVNCDYFLIIDGEKKIIFVLYRIIYKEFICK